jgi:glycosyltransferase involved in cell wall biosynthesis
MISVVIPTYKEPDTLDLCIRSAVQGQNNKNEIIVVLDGHYDVNKDVLDKYKADISILDLEQNCGQCRATNMGVYNSSNELILIVNDDNVFPKNWDVTLERAYKPNCVLAPNQIEPFPSMFRQFHIEDLGRDPNTFDLIGFWDREDQIKKDMVEDSGSTLPILMSKIDYLRVGGWDESYPGGWVVDWEFFMKCEMAGMKMIRTYNTNFYHFVSIGTKSEDRINDSKRKEAMCHEYFRYKWGRYPNHNPESNSKLF